MPKPAFVYIMSCRRRTTLYIGVTSDLARRVAEHRTHALSGFTKDYNLEHLVYFEAFDDVSYAITREKQLKKWSRGKKDALIAGVNPELRDLSVDLLSVAVASSLLFPTRFLDFAPLHSASLHCIPLRFITLRYARNDTENTPPSKQRIPVVFLPQ